MPDHYIYPEWPAPENVKAVSTTRHFGASVGAYASFNLGLSTGDDREIVLQNRAKLQKDLNLPTEPHWIKQTHSTIVATLPLTESLMEADASTTTANHCVCIIMTADCLPILICDRQGTQVAAIHAGWRGLSNGIVEQTIAHFSQARDNLIAWLGPAISGKTYEVGQDVYDSFCQANKEDVAAFTPRGEHKYLADMYQLARLRLNRLGIHAIYGGDRCTYTEQSCFYSYRRDATTGRMASLIWLE